MDSLAFLEPKTLQKPPFLLEHLRTKGFETDFAPTIGDYVSDYFTTEDGENVEWIYLLPQFELNGDYKQMNEEIDEMSLRKELRREREG